jgi:hypothetical protein
MSPHWWGILGLIGWAYLVCSLLYLWAGKSIGVIVIFLIVLCAMNAQEFFPVAGDHRIRIIVSASNFALVMSGVLATVIYLKYREDGRKMLFPALLLIPACCRCTALSKALLGHIQIIAPHRGPPSVQASASLSLPLSLRSLMAGVIPEARNYMHGRSALTCYLLPGIVYPLFWPLIQHLPDSLTGGLAGIVKSLLFASIIVLLTGWLEKKGIKLKL